MSRLIPLGGLGGLAWACGLRGFMGEVTPGPAIVTWTGTFVWILLPGVVIGSLLGFAEHLRRTTADPRGRLLVWSPFLFAAVFVAGVIRDGFNFQGGIGSSAIAVPALGVAGAYAFEGRRRWARVVCGLLALTPVAVVFAASSFGSPFSFTNAKDVWMALYLLSFLAVLMVATAVPLHTPPRSRAAVRDMADVP